LNDVGCIAEQCWQAIPKHHTRAELDEFVIMPNHVHVVIVIMDHDGVVVRGAARDPSNPFSVMSPYRDTVSVVVRTYKAAVTTLCRSVNRSDFGWQRNYYEHMIRSQDDLNRIREYILNNPANWESDKENSDEFRKGFCTHESARAQSPADPPPPQPVTRGTICFPHNPKIDFK
jgi:REP element-mobilizing transposase RayT